MAKLGDELRASFERQQAGLGDVGDARHRLIQNALAAPARESHRLQWAAAIAAVLIGAIVITTFALVHGNMRSQPIPATSPKANVSPTPLQKAINVPDSTPLILYHDPAKFDQVDGITWDGKASGRVIAGVTNGGFANSQGSLIATGPDLRNRGGHVVGTYDPKNQNVFLADDGAHLCSLDRVSSRDISSAGVLTYGLPGQSSRRVAIVGTLYPASSNAGGPSVIVCSPEADLVVVYQSGGQGVGVVQFWVIELSTGHIVWSGGGGAWISASHDGRRVALADGTGATTVFDGTNGQPLMHLTDMVVFAFSWDGSEAVVAHDFSSAPSIVNWRTGQTIWTCPGTAHYTYGQSFSEPSEAGSGRIAIGVENPAYRQTSGFTPVDLFVVDENGVQTFDRIDVVLIAQ